MRTQNIWDDLIPLPGKFPKRCGDVPARGGFVGRPPSTLACALAAISCTLIVSISMRVGRATCLQRSVALDASSRGWCGPRNVVAFLPRACAPPDYLAIVTVAYDPSRSDNAHREIEYRRGLDYLFSRFQRVAGVVSAPERMPLVAEYGFQPALHFTTSPRYTQKSAKESEALRHLVRHLNRTEGGSIPDSTIVFKASGRYQVVRDDFLQAVMANRDFDVWAKPFGSWTLDENGHHEIAGGDDKIFTFYFAMRWPLFRDMYAHIDLEKLQSHDTIPSKGWRGYDVESYIMDVVKERGFRLWRAPYLHVVANIDNEGPLRYL